MGKRKDDHWFIGVGNSVELLLDSLPRAKRRALLYFLIAIDQWDTDDTDATDQNRSVFICFIRVIRVLIMLNRIV